jgi:hypothetical protein
MAGVDVPWRLLLSLRCHFCGIGGARYPAGPELFSLDIVLRLLGFDAIRFKISGFKISGLAISVHG